MQRSRVERVLGKDRGLKVRPLPDIDSCHIARVCSALLGTLSLVSHSRVEHQTQLSFEH